MSGGKFGNDKFDITPEFSEPAPEMIDDENPEWTKEDFARARPAADVLAEQFGGDKVELKVGDVWLVKFPEEIELSTFKIGWLSDHVVQLRAPGAWSRYYLISDIQFIEKAKNS